MMSCSYTAACFIIFYLGGLYYKSRRWYRKVNAVAAWIKPSAKQVTAQKHKTHPLESLYKSVRVSY